MANVWVATASILSHTLVPMSSNLNATGRNPVESRLVSFADQRGLKIIAYVDEGPEEDWNDRFVILAPRYGETKKNSLQLSYTLVANGFKVLRFDQTNHIGESEGEMHQFTLSGASDDILAAVHYVDNFCEPAEISLVSLSLSCRSGFRAAAQDSRISRMINVVGMVDMDRTLQAIYKRDFFGELTVGCDWRMVDILGFEIDGKNFHDDLLESDMKSLSGTLVDAEKVTIPVLHLSAENDRWVHPEDVEHVLSKCSQGQLLQVPAVGHEINENTQALQFAFQQVILFCSEGLGLSAEAIQEPDKKTLIAQNKVERQRLQQIMKFADSENDFWGDYLRKFGIIEDAHFYAEYFQTMSGQLGSILDGDTILDAGCGNGFYGVSIVHSLMRDYQVGLGGIKNVHYCGIDLTANGLSRSYSRQNEELKRVAAESTMPLSPISYSYRKIDFDHLSERPGKSLPFADNTITKLCCSLVLSYLKEPSKLMEEFHRILSKGGVAVISSMKPGCDMTVLYHSYVDEDTPDEKRDQDANRLLSAAGKIKLKKDTGVYSFFSEAELERLAFDAGFSKITSCRSFGNQANVIRVVK